jgi:hypothetical protein
MKGVQYTQDTKVFIEGLMMPVMHIRRRHAEELVAAVIKNKQRLSTSTQNKQAEEVPVMSHGCSYRQARPAASCER